MGTERDEIFTCPCFCGKGVFSVVYCSPDHGWPTSTPFWYEYSIKCPDCHREYELVQQEDVIVAVNRADIAKKDRVEAEWHETSARLMKSPGVVEILASFSLYLSNLGSMAAVHRLLSKMQLEYTSLGTFRKNWAGAEKWVNSNVSPSNLPKIMDILGLKDKAVLAEVSRVNELWEGFHAKLPSVGDPIYRCR